MIKNITGGPGIHVSGNSFSMPYIHSGTPSAGLVRYCNNNFEVYDGSSWIMMSSSFPQVELDDVTQEAIAWVRRKMEQEKQILELAKTNPTVADALLARDRAEDALRITMALCDTR